MHALILCAISPMYTVLLLPRSLNQAIPDAAINSKCILASISIKSRKHNMLHRHQMIQWKNTGFGATKMWVCVLIWSLNSCVTMKQLCVLSLSSPSIYNAKMHNCFKDLKYNVTILVFLPIFSAYSVATALLQ